jgi:hypothetical protein
MAATSKQTMKYAFGPYFSIVLQFSAFDDPLQTTGEPSVAREQRKLAAIYITRLSYAHWSRACRCRGRQNLSPGS